MMVTERWLHYAEQGPRRIEVGSWRRLVRNSEIRREPPSIQASRQTGQSYYRWTPSWGHSP